MGFTIFRGAGARGRFFVVGGSWRIGFWAFFEARGRVGGGVLVSLFNGAGAIRMERKEFTARANSLFTKKIDPFFIGNNVYY